MSIKSMEWCLTRKVFLLFSLFRQMALQQLSLLSFVVDVVPQYCLVLKIWDTECLKSRLVDHDDV